MTRGASAIAITGLAKSYRDGDVERQVFCDFDLQVENGAVVALCGPSGVGKSTLLNIVAGLVQFDAGEVWVDTPDERLALHTLSQRQRTRFRRRHVGYVFQFFNLVPTLTVFENVQLPLSLVSRRLEDNVVAARLESLGLGGRGDDFPETLSGGERQRVAIARALAHEPSIVLADEPTGNLDAVNTERVAQLLIEQTRALRSTLLVATHNPMIAAMADTTIDLKPGN